MLYLFNKNLTDMVTTKNKAIEIAKLTDKVTELTGKQNEFFRRAQEERRQGFHNHALKLTRSGNMVYEEIDAVNRKIDALNS